MDGRRAMVLRALKLVGDNVFDDVVDAEDGEVGLFGEGFAGPGGGEEAVSVGAEEVVIGLPKAPGAAPDAAPPGYERQAAGGLPIEGQFDPVRFVPGVSTLSK